MKPAPANHDLLRYDAVHGDGAYMRDMVQRTHSVDDRPYGEWCRDPKLCAGKGYCPRDPTCGD